MLTKALQEIKIRTALNPTIDFLNQARGELTKGLQREVGELSDTITSVFTETNYQTPVQRLLQEIQQIYTEYRAYQDFRKKYDQTILLKKKERTILLKKRNQEIKETTTSFPDLDRRITTYTTDGDIAAIKWFRDSDDISHLSKGRESRYEGHNGKTYKIPDQSGGSDRPVVYSGPTKENKHCNFSSERIESHFNPPSKLFNSVSTATIIQNGGVAIY